MGNLERELFKYSLRSEALSPQNFVNPECGESEKSAVLWRCFTGTSLNWFLKNGLRSTLRDYAPVIASQDVAIVENEMLEMPGVLWSSHMLEYSLGIGMCRMVQSEFKERVYLLGFPVDADRDSVLEFDSRFDEDSGRGVNVAEVPKLGDNGKYIQLKRRLNVKVASSSELTRGVIIDTVSAETMKKSVVYRMDEQQVKTISLNIDKRFHDSEYDLTVRIKNLLRDMFGLAVHNGLKSEMVGLFSQKIIVEPNF